ncbi:MAG: hypothetical protein R3195_18450 [Gemmatimonadota bacterium]|nr:hypothetical protein [Gemmatimonadota bacterium]
MATRFREMVDNLRQDRLLFGVGLLGLILGAGLLIFIAVRGSALMAPEGQLRKAATFDIALGIFILTMILMERAAPMSRRGRRVWSGLLAFLVLYAYAMENVQILRGLDPRFSNVAGPTDQILGGVFFLSAVAIMLLFVALAVRFFRRSTAGPDGPLLLALRYGSVAALIGFTVGIVISANGTAEAGAAGNWLPLHALGFHGVQAVPLVALMLGWAGASAPDARRAVHFAGAAWLATCLAVGWQTLAGGGVLSPSLPIVVAALAFALWGATFARAALASRSATA